MMRLTTLVFVSMVAACSWGDGSGQEPTGDDGGDDQQTVPVCGDGTCASSEVNSCAADCGGGQANNDVCGDGSCTGTETANSCPSDCSQGGGGGSGSGSNAACPADLLVCLCTFVDPSTCPAGITEELCLECAFGGGGFPGGGGGGFGDVLCEGGAPNGVCDASEDETVCPSDCP